MDKLIYYMKMREKYILRSVGDIYYLSQIGESDKKRVIRINESAVYLWNLLFEFQGEEAIQKFCMDYDISEEKANSEIRRFLDSLEQIVTKGM